MEDTSTGEEFEEMMMKVEEEVFADAYAGINAFGAGADQFTEAVNERMDQLYIGKLRDQENGTEKPTGPPAERFSVAEIQGVNANYGEGVILDTNVFDGINPRNWGEALSRYVYSNLAGAEMTIYDDTGNEERICLARANDRVRKDGAKNNHKVIDKLARYRGDNITALAVVHLSELLQTSRYENSTDEHNHQWMDEKGWEYRKAYVQDTKGKIYEATLNIAKGRERRILYAISNVKYIDKTRAARGVVSSTNSGGDSLTKGNSLGDSVPEEKAIVKKKSRKDSLMPARTPTMRIWKRWKEPRKCRRPGLLMKPSVRKLAGL